MITTDDYLAWDGVEMGARVRAGEVTADELAAACADRIAAVDPTVHAVADLAATPIDDPAGRAGPFAGVPFAVKELLGVPGLPWTFGSRLFAGNQAPAASPYVERLLRAGLRTVSSTTSSEFGLLGSTESFLRGPTANPWNTRCSAGGSSGGAAVVTAAGIVPLAHANDAGGSIRYPGGDERPVRPAADTRPLRTRRAAAHRAGRTRRRALRQPHGATTAPAPRRHRAHGRRGALPTRRARRFADRAAAAHRRDAQATFLGAEPDAAVGGARDWTLVLFDRLGYYVVDDTPPAVEKRRSAGHRVLHDRGADDGRGRDDDEPGARPTARPRRTGAVHARTDRVGEHAAVRRRRRRGPHVRRGVRFVPLVLRPLRRRRVPTISCPPWTLGTFDPDLGRRTLVERTEQLVGYTPIANVAGCPAASMPLEWADGLPIGIHVAAAPGGEATILGLALELEAAQPWADRRPMVARRAPGPEGRRPPTDRRGG